jgi:drug/metabolite transporter (DMT)-like permease
MFWLIVNTTPIQASVPSYLAPLVAALLGWAWLGQRLTPTIALAALLILGGAILIAIDRALRLRYEEGVGDNDDAGSEVRPTISHLALAEQE